MRTTILTTTALWLGLAAYGQKITLTSKNIINVSGKGDATLLVDEQTLAGDPASTKCTTCPSTVFTNGYVNQTLYYPLEVVVDLWGEYNVTSFYYYDVNDSDSIFVSTGTPAAWTPIIKSTTSKYDAWSANTINQKTRYLQLKIKSPKTMIAEIVVYGTPTGTITAPKAPTPVVMQKPDMQNFMGMNSFFNVPDSIGKAVKYIREYHNWQWDEGNTSTIYAGYPNNQYAWAPSWVDPTWNFDTYYTNAFKKGQVVCALLQGSAPYVTGFGDTASVSKPLINSSLNPQDPASYIQHADYMFQFAARYGSTRVALSKLKVRVTNTVLTGLGLLDYMENWNEPDKDWDGRNAYFKPFELAAMSSADYDGHQSKMGTTFGLKNADPSMKMVLAGLVNIDTLEIKSIVFWSNYFRSGSLPFDAINFHHYSNDAGGQGGNPTKGISPEADNLKTKVKQMTQFRDKNLPGTEVWYSEFGYDTNPSSVQRAPAVGSQDAWEVQARWILRSFLAYAAGGADKAFIYMSRDVDESGTKFNSSGLATPPTNGTYKAYTKKKSWYYVYTFRKRLAGYRFKEEISSGNANVSVYSFENIADPKKLIYAVWAPTSTDLSVSNYSLPLPVNTSNVTKIEIVNKDTTGTETALSIKSGTVSLTVDEKPDLIAIQTSPVTSLESEMPSTPTSFFAVFPNPFQDKIGVRVPNSETMLQVVVRDIRGVAVKSFSGDDIQDALPLEELAKGVYILEGTSDKHVYVSKIIKN